MVREEQGKEGMNSEKRQNVMYRGELGGMRGVRIQEGWEG